MKFKDLKVLKGSPLSEVLKDWFYL